MESYLHQVNFAPAAPNLSAYIDCFWESHEVKAGDTFSYPSLPEPYISLYFPLQPVQATMLKGLADKPSSFTMRAQLFGVRLHLKGFYQLQLGSSVAIKNQLVLINQTTHPLEYALGAQIQHGESFNERIQLFEAYFHKKLSKDLSGLQLKLANAMAYFIKHYRNPTIIQDYAQTLQLSERTINRWFSADIGINPKKLARIVRFNNALYNLHALKEEGFYFDHGYFDQAHFIKEFKQFTGLSPDAYLKRVSEMYN